MSDNAGIGPLSEQLSPKYGVTYIEKQKADPKLGKF
jgi:hypothetical protein